MDTRGNSRANTCDKTRLLEGLYLLDTKPILLVIQDNFANLMAYAGGESFKFLPYQLSMVRYWLTMVSTGNGELGFDSGEGA